jgi:PAS domain S-box-containing protein
MASSTQSSNRRVLSICDDITSYDFLKQALHVSNAAAISSKDKTTEMLSATIVNPSALSFELVSAKDWHMAYQEIMEAKGKGMSFPLIVLTVRMDSWDIVRENIEKIWKLDETIRCILCLPSDVGEWPMGLSLSRPEQWVIFRMSGVPEELFQLAACLGVCPSSSDQCRSDELKISDPKSQIESGLQPLGTPIIAEQQTELALARDELATSKAYVNNVLRSMADSLLVIDANLTIGSVNPSLLELLGYEEDALVGQSPGLIFGEEFAQGSIIENLLLQGSVSGIESSFLTSEGRLIPISVSGPMMQDEQGQFQGLVCVAQDISERKRMEEEKLQLHEQLLDTSRQLGMAEVASDVLHNVGNVLNSINVSIGVVADLLKNSMVGDVGRISQLFHKHRDDLGNYFSSNPKGKQIPVYLEKLSGQLMEEQRVAIAELNRLRENAQHAQHCVAAQQDVAKVTGITEPISVVALMEEALTTNQEWLGASQIGVIREFEEIPLLIVDKHQVLEVLVDVIRNACQAMASVSIKQLVVRAKIIPGPPDSVCLEVEDSGVGIAYDDLTKIFGQGHNTKDGGCGMSLHSGALMAKNFGGALRAHSEGIGHGATFSLELPGNFHFPDL